jgi:hypothetical protein
MPRNMGRYNELQRREERLEHSRNDYLRARGWVSTCDTPGSIWLWTRVYHGRILAVQTSTAVLMQGHIDSGVYDPDAPPKGGG